MEIQNRTFKQGGAYESPSLTALDVMSEGLLCVSAPGMTIDSATEEDWGTL